MRITLTILAMSMLIYGCSQKQHASVSSAFDSIPVGRDVHYGTYILHLDKRDGNSVQGIHIVDAAAGVTVTADRGSLTQGTNFPIVRTITTEKGSVSRVTNYYPVVTMVLYDAHYQRGKHTVLVREMPFDLTRGF